MLDDFDTLKRGRISERVLAAAVTRALTIRPRTAWCEACSTASTFRTLQFRGWGAARWDEIAEQMGGPRSRGVP